MEDQQTIGGPYFRGQQPAPCGHYYPDVHRLHDEYGANGVCYRIMDCIFCDQYSFPIHSQAYNHTPGTTEGLNRWREEERQRLRQIVIEEPELNSTGSTDE